MDRLMEEKDLPDAWKPKPKWPDDVGEAKTSIRAELGASTLPPAASSALPHRDPMVRRSRRAMARVTAALRARLDSETANAGIPTKPKRIDHDWRVRQWKKHPLDCRCPSCEYVWFWVDRGEL
jgi:hypothetical protein